jgi:hypothetical protein
MWHGASPLHLHLASRGAPIIIDGVSIVAVLDTVAPHTIAAERLANIGHRSVPAAAFVSTFFLAISAAAVAIDCVAVVAVPYN